MKKFFTLLLSLLLISVLVLVPYTALAGYNTVAALGIDWTPLVVALIGLISAAMAALMSRAWMTYVKPWLEQKKLTDAATIVVNAVEALLGRYCGEDKWALALKKMQEMGFNIDSDAVLDALRAAWKALDLAQLTAGDKEKPPEVAEESSIPTA